MEAVCFDTHPHILLAEDDKDLRELLHFALSQAGYLVSCCDNGLKLLEMLEQSDAFDLVLSDLRMPAFTGLEVLEYQHDNQHRPPFICMTAFGDRQTHETARRFGATATIDKPFDLDEMIELVKNSLQNNQRVSPVRSCP